MFFLFSQRDKFETDPMSSRNLVRHLKTIGIMLLILGSCGLLALGFIFIPKIMLFVVLGAMALGFLGLIYWMIYEDMD